MRLFRCIILRCERGERKLYSFVRSDGVLGMNLCSCIVTPICLWSMLFGYHIFLLDASTVAAPICEGRYSMSSIGKFQALTLNGSSPTSRPSAGCITKPPAYVTMIAFACTYGQYCSQTVALYRPIKAPVLRSHVSDHGPARSSFHIRRVSCMPRRGISLNGLPG